MMALYADALRVQCEAMLTQAKRADERGYCVLVHGLNSGALDNGFLYGPFAGALLRWLEERRSNAARRVAVVNVFPEAAAATTGKPFDGALSFSLELPKTRSWRPICSAIELMSAKRERVEGVYQTRGTGVFVWKPMSSCHHYSGSGRTALETLLRILEIPHHRRIMTGRP